METDENVFIEQLKATHPEFRRLTEEHLHYEAQLDAFNKLRYLTSEQEVEKKRLQKLKLRDKDRMAELLNEYKARIGG
jgi:uncharacterized protein YdcH (DUF465 family)